MSDFVNTIDLLGDEEVTKRLIERTITEFNDDVIQKIRQGCFYACNVLTSVNFPNATYVGESGFHSCSALANMNLPKVTGTGNHAFSGCASLTNVVMPSLKKVAHQSFSSCAKLTIVDFRSATSIDSNAFWNAKALKTVILRSETLCALAATSAFIGTYFYTGYAGGTLIVPRSLTTEYPNATNWSSLMSGNANNRILALEDYTVDGTITGEIDWDKLNGGTTT